jgi:hypothetical protein
LGHTSTELTSNHRETGVCQRLSDDDWRDRAQFPFEETPPRRHLDRDLGVVSVETDVRGDVREEAGARGPTQRVAAPCNTKIFPPILIHFDSKKVLTENNKKNVLECNSAA